MTKRPFIFRLAQWVSIHSFETLYRLEAEGLENIPSKGPLLIASNHASFMDPPIIGGVFPRGCWFFARKTLFKGPISNYFLRELLTIPVDRDGDSDVGAMKRVVQLLKAEESIVIFPEGTRTRNGLPQPIRPGIGWLACKGGASILPTRIEGSFDIWNREHKLPVLGPTLKITFGQPITPEEYDPGASVGKARFQISAERIEARLQAHWNQGRLTEYRSTD